MDGSGFIRELCVALEYRWIPGRIFLLFIAFFDESDTHGPKPHLVLGGYLGTARQWELFERKIKALQRRYGFSIFHAKEFRSGSGEFRGWSMYKKQQLVSDIATAIRDGLTEGITTALPREDYENFYRNEPFPQRMHKDSQYGVCFRLCLHHLLNLLTRDGKKHKIHVVIESGHVNVGDTDRIFNELKDEYDREGIKVLGDLTIARKSERLPLMIADFQAHASYLSERRIKRGQPGYFEMTEGRMPARGQAGLTQLGIDAEILRGLKTGWERTRQQRAEKWRADRAIAARSTSSVSPADGDDP